MSHPRFTLSWIALGSLLLAGFAIQAEADYGVESKRPLSDPLQAKVDQRPVGTWRTIIDGKQYFLHAGTGNHVGQSGIPNSGSGSAGLILARQLSRPLRIAVGVGAGPLPGIIPPFQSYHEHKPNRLNPNHNLTPIYNSHFRPHFKLEISKPLVL